MRFRVIPWCTHPRCISSYAAKPYIEQEGMPFFGDAIAFLFGLFIMESNQILYRKYPVDPSQYL